MRIAHSFTKTYLDKSRLRMSFYRNYDSIEDILIEHLDAVVEQYKIEDIDERIKETEKVYYGKKYMIHTFGFFYQNHDFIDTLIS